jgi:ABC-type transport system involved in multi-copper enzyme maturation permease subunit
MFLTCLRKELLLNLTSARAVLTLALLVTAMMAATVVRTRIYQAQARDFQQAQAALPEVRGLACRASSSLYTGSMAAKAPNPLAIFAGGVENEMSRSVRFSYAEWMTDAEPLLGNRALNSPAFRQLFMPDALLLVALIGSLFALVLVFDAVCGEQELGTLRLLLAGPLPRDTLLAAKVAAGLITITVPLLLAWAASLAWVVLQGHVPLALWQLGRVGLLAGVSVVFVCAFFALGIAVSAWTQRSATALGLCLLCWIGLALVLPSAVPVLARHVAPTPPASRIILEREVALRDITEHQQPLWIEQIMREKGVKGWGPVWEAGLAKMREQAIGRANERIERDYHARLKRQTELAQAVSRLSPVASFVSCATHLAGTGIADYHRYLADVDAFQLASTDARGALEQKSKDAAGKRDVYWDEIPLDPAGWPAFRPGVARLGDVVAACWLDVVLLAGTGVFFFLVAIAGFVRYRV